MKKSLKEKYISCAFLLLVSTVIVKIISAVYKIPLTNYIGATGRGYFSVAYNLCMPIHAITMGAFPIALTKLVSTYNAKGEKHKIAAIKKASRKLFFIVGLAGLLIMLVLAKPYTEFVSSPKSIYTVLALAPCVFFSCLGASRRAFAEGFLDMRPTAISQTIEALFKMVFGLLFARLSMNYLYGIYIDSGLVLGTTVSGEEEALLSIYPITSACAMLGAALGDFVAYLFLCVYSKINYKYPSSPKSEVKSAYNELLSFSCALVGATALQSISNFLDNTSIQYFLSLCDAEVLSKQFSVSADEVLSYVFGIYAVDLDFRNLIPSFVMALGITAVPAVSVAYEGGQENFSSVLTSILKYTVILSTLGGIMLSLFSREMLSIFYSQNNSDIVENGSNLLFWFGVTALPGAVASTTVFCTQSLGFAKNTIMPFAVSAVIRIAVNYFLITDNNINILGSAFSNFIGFSVIALWNLYTIRSKTKAKINYKEIFIKPIFCAVLAYFVSECIKSKLIPETNSILIIAINVIICLFIFFLLQFLTKTITFSEIKRFK